jgi:hypothetical protein
MIEELRTDERGRVMLLNALIGEGLTPEVTAAVLLFCKQAMRRRNSFVQCVLDQKT